MLHPYTTLVDHLHTLEGWQAECVRTFVQRIGDPAFPCTFAKGAITRGGLHFTFGSFAAGPEAAWAAVGAALSDYAELERHPDPYRVLAICFDHRSASWDEDDELLWSFCRWMVEHDPEPPSTPLDLDRPGPSIPFKGMPWFVNVNSPRYEARHSRNTTDRLAFVLQRTDSFAGLAPVHQHLAVRDGIRARIAPYDGQAASPSLAGYAHNPDGVEWRQFHLPEDNATPPVARCPFHAPPRG